MFAEIKFWIGIGITVILIGLGVAVYIQSTRIKSLRTELEYAVVNNKAYEAENDSLINKNIAFNFTIAQLNYNQDSLVKELNRVRKQLKVKDKQIDELQYIASHTRKVDSIFIRDTIFKDPELNLDTLIANEWAKLKLHLQYPNEIDADYSFKNETIIVSSTKVETVDPPHKCWFIRLFQKKHKVVEVEVIQNNPYCENDLHKHIKIVE